jgi:hypothetical protein
MIGYRTDQIPVKGNETLAFLHGIFGAILEFLFSLCQ